MEFSLPAIGKPAIANPHFPTAHQTFIFRAAEYVSMEKIAQVLGTEESNVRRCAEEMGVPDYQPGDLWLQKGYITIIRSLWHILPYDQLLQLLEMDDQTLAVILREEDFLDIKLGDKPACEPVRWRELTQEEAARTRQIKELMSTVDISGRKPFDFTYDVPEISFSGNQVFDTRMVYGFSGLYQTAFDVDSRIFCPDEQLEAYQKVGINGIWTQGVLFQLTEFPFEPEISKGWQQRLERMKAFADRLETYGIKLYLYLNEPRSMPEVFYEKHPNLRGHTAKPDKVCLCTSTPEVQAYLTDAIETICRAVPNIGGFFTISRSENPTNCYSHSKPDGSCTCPRCSKRPLEEVVAENIACFRNGANRVDPRIKVIAWNWSWDEFDVGIINRLPEGVIFQAKSEEDIPFTIGGVQGKTSDYSMSIIGPGENAKKCWAAAKARGLEVAAKIQVNTTWEASTVPAVPVYQSIEDHIRGVKEQGVSHLMLSWTLGGYPSRNIAHAAKYFYENCRFEEKPVFEEAGKIFSEAFREFPFCITTIYKGPINAGPSTLLYEEPTGYKATMTCYAYDDLRSWCSIYPQEVFENQLEKLCNKWQKGIDLLKDEPDSETAVMAKGTYCLFKAGLEQVRFYRARACGDKAAMVAAARCEETTARNMLALMNQNPAIGFEAANHYYFSRGQLAEKILNCRYLIEKLS